MYTLYILCTKFYEVHNTTLVQEVVVYQYWFALNDDVTIITTRG